MPVTMVNGGGMLSWQGGIDHRKNGTSGYDYSRGVHKKIRTMYKAILPRHLVDMFTNDGHMDASMARMTAWSVGEGTIQTMEGRVIVEPSNMGTALMFPEGLPEGDVSGKEHIGMCN